MFLFIFINQHINAMTKKLKVYTVKRVIRKLREYRDQYGRVKKTPYPELIVQGNILLSAGIDSRAQVEIKACNGSITITPIN